MQEYIIQNKLEQFIENYQQIKEVKGSWSMGMIQYSCALSLTIKNQYANKDKIEENLKVIKDNTGIFSNFRGYSMYYTAILLSTKFDAQNDFREILDIYKRLKDKSFWGDTYLPFVAIILYENKNKIDIDTCIDNMKYVYEFMKKHHPFLTSSDDYCRIALIAINSKDIDKDLDYIEKCYENLKSNGFYPSNNLQALSHIMCFDKHRNDESIDKIIKLKDLMAKENCKMDSYGYPLIGAISLLDCDEDTLVSQIKKVSDSLKEVKGFGNWSLGKNNRNMISSAIVASAYADYLKKESNVDTISNNIFLDIIIAIEIACMVATMAAVSASASASS
ncbi:DUF4003 family protein [Paraclostridium sordellii]|uniref:DUF4003 family protein n=1 Tax=Paraclostridium sordellii TaxID=1505 RepID=UPI0003187C6D|nr:DUF4003 family protein [Paeniclostridium sordellii]